MGRRGLAVAACWLVAGMGWTGAEAPWVQAESGYAWSFPRDHWAHPGYGIEWWYFTGHLESDAEPKRRFGYQFTIFRVGLLPTLRPLDSGWNASNLLMGHAAVTDKDRQEHRFSELLYRDAPLLAEFKTYPEQPIARSRAPVGTEGEWILRWNGQAFDFEMVDDAHGFAFDLTTRPLKPRVFHGPNGLSRKADEPGAASLYYSFSRLVTQGRLTLDGESWKVRGESWMDMEFSSSQLTEEQVGWDWFSLQLEDGRDLMLFAMRRGDGEDGHRRGTVISADGRTRYLEGEEWVLRRTARWTSRESGIVYPAAWALEIPGESLSLTIRPDVADQENRSRLSAGPKYWEGAVTLTDRSGDRVGRGYVELTGYGENNRPPI